MRQHFLHLSDLHFRPDWPEQPDLICNKLFDDLATQYTKFPDAYLIFSGDFVQAGGDEGLYASFEKRFDAALTNVGLPIDKRICIPGNHDTARPVIKPTVTMRQGALNMMTDETLFNNNMQHLSGQSFAPAFANYMQFEKRFAAINSCANGVGGSGWELPNGIAVYCLNTALCSFGGLEDAQGKKIVDKGKLMIDTRSLYQWLNDNSSTTRILVMHHPVDCLVDWARDELQKIISDYFHLVVSGHVHIPSAKYSSTGAGSSVHCVAPALFTRKSEALGYSFITVDDASIEVYYDSSKPYNQELAKFIETVSLRKMISTMRGAARALRNSDHVDPNLKTALMKEVVCCWRRVCQILAVLSPILAERRRAHFEGMNYILDDSFDDKSAYEVRIGAVLSSIPHNITLWYEDDIFSRKLGVLFGKYVADHMGTLDEALVLLVMATQRSPGWEKEIDNFIERSEKNSFYLWQVFQRLFAEFKTGITNEKTRQQLRRLAAKAVAKHQGAKHPSPKVIERTAKNLDASIDS